MQPFSLTGGPPSANSDSLGATELTEERLPCQVLRCIWYITDLVIVVGEVICKQTVDLTEINKKT